MSPEAWERETVKSKSCLRNWNTNFICICVCLYIQYVLCVCVFVYMWLMVFSSLFSCGTSPRDSLISYCAEIRQKTKVIIFLAVPEAWRESQETVYSVNREMASFTCNKGPWECKQIPNCLLWTARVTLRLHKSHCSHILYSDETRAGDIYTLVRPIDK